MRKTKSQLLDYYYRPEFLNESEIQKLFYHIFGTKAHHNYQINYRYLTQSLKYPEIYKTRFNK